MKEYLQFHYSEGKFKSYTEQREQLEEVWAEVVIPGLLQELIESMPVCIQVVIDTDGKFTKY